MNEFGSALMEGISLFMKAHVPWSIAELSGTGEMIFLLHSVLLISVGLCYFWASHCRRSWLEIKEGYQNDAGSWDHTVWGFVKGTGAGETWKDKTLEEADCLYAAIRGAVLLTLSCGYNIDYPLKCYSYSTGSQAFAQKPLLAPVCLLYKIKTHLTFKSLLFQAYHFTFFYTPYVLAKWTCLLFISLLLSPML